MVPTIEMFLLPLLMVSCWLMLRRSLASLPKPVPVRVRRDRDPRR